MEYRYFRDYIYYWEEFLDDLTLRPYSTTEEGVRVTEILSGPEAPIKNILAAVQKNVALTKMPVSKNQKAAAAVAAAAAQHHAAVAAAGYNAAVYQSAYPYPSPPTGPVSSSGGEQNFGHNNSVCVLYKE